MTGPAPYEPRQHVVFKGNTVVITARHPHLDSWRYAAIRADLAGDEVHFDHDMAAPMPRPARRAAIASAVLTMAGLDPDVYAQELAQVQADEQEHPRTPLDELLAVVREVAHGVGGQRDIHQAYLTYTEATA